MERTKKLNTEETAILRFVGPVDQFESAVRYLRKKGFVECSDSVEWEELFPDSSPGSRLTGARHKEGLTQRQLSNLTNIPQRHISEMETGKRSIGKERAKTLADVLNVAYQLFL